MMKQRLFTPGPTPVPEKVMLAMAQPIIHHRHKEFIEMLERVNDNLRYLFQTRNNVYMLTASGTGAMETAVSNLLSRGEIALFVNAGKFGERWGELCAAYGIEAEEVCVEWGEAVDPGEIAMRLRRRKDIRAVFVTHSETSTGVAQDVKEIARTVKECSDAIVVVDGITSIGALEMRMDDRSIDVALTGSQKGLMITPGLSFIAVSDRAWKAVEGANLPRYYFDLRKAKSAITAEGTPWTPAVSLVTGLDVALGMIREEGLENVWTRHDRMAKAVREGCQALGLRVVASVPSNALTAVSVPPGVDAGKLSSLLKDKYGITVAGGQGKFKGKIIRLSHLGYYDVLDMVAIVSALEMALTDCGWKFQTGEGVRAAQKYLLPS
jgi:serine---pyruvate transaminase